MWDDFFVCRCLSVCNPEVRFFCVRRSFSDIEEGQVCEELFSFSIASTLTEIDEKTQHQMLEMTDTYGRLSIVQAQVCNTIVCVREGE